MSIKFAFNFRTLDHNKLKFIIVGDNPGKKEFEQNKYFVGQSGAQLRNHFEKGGLVENFDEECLIINKTFLSTEKTNDLKNIKNEIGAESFDKILLHSAYEITSYSKSLDLPVLIFGKSQLGKGKIFHPFWEKLQEICEPEKIFVFKHPSNSGFASDWNKYRTIYQDKNDLELLYYIGKFHYHQLKL